MMTPLRQYRLSHLWRSVLRASAAAAVLLALLTVLLPQLGQAATTVPLSIVYNGHLLDSNGSPITTAHNVRFSFWSSADYAAGDVDGAGAINTGAGTYQSWNEVHTVTPDSRGYFTVNLGSVTALPDIADFSPALLQSFFLQVEVKASASANTAYELMDVNSSNAAVDRSPVASVPFALNADYLDRREVGTGSGDVAILSAGGIFNPSLIPGGTDANFFTIDYDNTESGDITLEFGNTLNKTLLYDQDDSLFRFNDSVAISGDLTVTGLINGIDINSLSAATTDSHLRVASGAGLTVSVAGGGYRVGGTTTHYAGSGSVTVRNNTTNYLFFTGTGLVISTAGFPAGASGSHIRLAEVVTSGGNVTIVRDRRVFQSDDREQEESNILQPNFEGASYRADGTNNVGQLTVEYDSVNRRNFYLWTSTRDTLQDYDVALPIRIPEGFLGWQSPALQIDYRTSAEANTNNKLDVFLFDTAGNAVSLSGTSTDLASSTWATTSLGIGGSPTWTAGQDAILLIRLSAGDDEQANLGTVELHMQSVTP